MSRPNRVARFSSRKLHMREGSLTGTCHRLKIFSLRFIARISRLFFPVWTYHNSLLLIDLKRIDYGWTELFRLFQLQMLLKILENVQLSRLFVQLWNLQRIRFLLLLDFESAFGNLLKTFDGWLTR